MGGRSLPTTAGGGSAAEDSDKSSWPELVGKNMLEAVPTIKVDRPDVILKLLGADDPQPPDFDAHRVCLFLDDGLNVVRTPVVG